MKRRYRVVMAFVLAMAVTVTTVVTPAFAITSTAPTPPAIGKGAATTGVYRNMLVEAGVTDATTANNKLNELYNYYFTGTDTACTKRLYYEVGTDKAIISEGGASGTTITEGQSYGMMITVQMNKKTEFDKLWTFARNCMYRTSGQYKGYFSNSVKGNGEILDEGPAPDGEEYFAMALMMAAARWGNGTGIYNYQTEANQILSDMVATRAYPLCPSIVNTAQNQIRFAPYCEWTDPSYHVPAFYDYFASYGSSNNSIWSAMATKSRNMWLTFASKGNGLTPCYATYAGAAYDDPNVNHGYGPNFKADAYRSVMNAALDYSWWAKSTNEITYANQLCNWMNNELTKNSNTIYSEYDMNGNKLTTYDSIALYACNAVASLAANSDSWNNGYGMVNRFWTAIQTVPTGTYRYWSGILSMLAMLQLTGNYKMYTVPNMVTASTYTITNKNSGKAVEVNSQSLSENAILDQWGFWGANYQKWTFVDTGSGKYKIKNVNSGKIMTVLQSSTANSASIVQATDTSANSQLFRLLSTGDGYFKIQNVNSGKVLDISGASKADAGKVIQYTDSGATNQRFLVAVN